MDQSEEELLRSRGFGQRMGFGRQPALIVIDMLKAFTDPALPLGSDLSGPIEAISQLMRAAQTQVIPILLATVIYEDPGMLDAGIWALKQTGSVTLRAGTGGSDFDPRLPLRGTESILRKKYASCFFGTDLVPRLLAQRVDTLIIAGCTTSGCVRATAVDSVQYGFRPMVVREAVGDRSASAHAQSLSDIDAKYGDVVSLEQTLAYFGSLARQISPRV
jgi:nicotinamidase-related amidase